MIYNLKAAPKPIQEYIILTLIIEVLKKKWWKHWKTLISLNKLRKEIDWSVKWK